jgi:hypothetical protein
MKMFRVCALCLIGFSRGAVIAWSTVALAFIRFYRAEGTLLKVTNCRFPNPITTPCFYGAIAFVVALLWAASLPRGAKPGSIVTKVCGGSYWLRRSSGGATWRMSSGDRTRARLASS